LLVPTLDHSELFAWFLYLKNFEEKPAFDITESFSVLFYVSCTKRLGSIIQGMQLFGKIILSCSFSQPFAF